MGVRSFDARGGVTRREPQQFTGGQEWAKIEPEKRVGKVATKRRAKKRRR